MLLLILFAEHIQNIVRLHAAPDQDAGEWLANCCGIDCDKNGKLVKIHDRNAEQLHDGPQGKGRK